MPERLDLYNRDIPDIYSAMNSTVRRIGIVQHNIDNVKTIAYKSINPDSVLFSDTLQDVFRDESTGSLMDTNRKLDFALTHPNGFFLVEGENGPERTRDGNFHLDAEGKLINFEGKEVVVLDRDGRYEVLNKIAYTENVGVDKEGKIYVDNEYVGRLAIDFANKMPGDVCHIAQGKLETANVDLTSNLTRIMELKRHVDSLQGVMAMEMAMDKALVEAYGRNV